MDIHGIWVFKHRKAERHKNIKCHNVILEYEKTKYEPLKTTEDRNLYEVWQFTRSVK